MQIYQGIESKIKIALKMGKTNLSAFTEGKDSNPWDACDAYTLSRRAPSASSDNLPQQ